MEIDTRLSRTVSGPGAVQLSGVRRVIVHLGSAGSRPAPAVIQVSGNGFVEIPADHAVLVLGVEVEAPSPGSATAQMGTLLAQVTDTLMALGIPRDSLPTSRIDLQPRFSTIGASA